MACFFCISSLTSKAAKHKELTTQHNWWGELGTISTLGTQQLEFSVLLTFLLEFGKDFFLQRTDIRRNESNIFISHRVLLFFQQLLMKVLEVVIIWLPNLVATGTHHDGWQQPYIEKR